MARIGLHFQFPLRISKVPHQRVPFSGVTAMPPPKQKVTKFVPVSKMKNGKPGMAKGGKVVLKITGQDFKNDLPVKAVAAASGYTWSGSARNTSPHGNHCRATLLPVITAFDAGRADADESVSVTVGDATPYASNTPVGSPPTLFDGCYALGCQGTGGRYVWLSPDEEFTLFLADATTSPI